MGLKSAALSLRYFSDQDIPNYASRTATVEVDPLKSLGGRYRGSDVKRLQVIFCRWHLGASNSKYGISAVKFIVLPMSPAVCSNVRLENWTVA